MVKYKEYFQKMLQANEEAFANFRQVHDQYALNEGEHQAVFNQAGQKILAIVKEWENRLCAQSEKAGFANYSGGLAEKFQAEVKKEFPLIDRVGLIVKPFILKKISL